MEDIRVLDHTHVWFGPWCTMMLAELGAEVIKIEPPWGALDRIPEAGRMYGGVSATFHHLNLNKKDIAIDLKNPKGLKIYKELVKISDVVVENFTPGTMKKMGIDYEELRKIKPDIILASLSGFGQTGPYSHRPSYAVIAEAMAGFTRAQGDSIDPNGPPRAMTGAFGDLAPGTMAAMSIIAAIRYRDKTGKGQWIDVAQTDCMVAYNTRITEYFLSGKTEIERRQEQEEQRRRAAAGGAVGAMSIGGIMKTKDGYIHVMAGRAKGLDALKQKLGVKELNRDDVLKMVEHMTREEAINFFIELDLPVAPILYGSEATKDPHILSRNMFVEVVHPKAGKIKVVNFPVKFSETPGQVISAAPLLGQHTREILMNYLGYKEEEINQLMKEGVIAEEKLS
ncbi:MAG: CaiB/BaiF CoA-transferase family protein [Candidatus Bathyarchaeia archaeon]